MRALLLLLAACPAAAVTFRAPARVAPPRLTAVPRLPAPALGLPKLAAAPTPTLSPLSPVIDGRAPARVLLDADDFEPSRFLAALKRDPSLAAAYAADAGVDEGWTIERHTLGVMSQAELHLKDKLGSRRALFRAVLALHDIGKARSRARQHEFTVPILREQLARLGFSAEDIALGAALVDGDPIGSYLKGGDADASAAKLRRMAESSGVPPREFAALLVGFYMADASSYPKLGWLFEPGSLRFVPEVRRRVAGLLSKVLS